MTVVSNTTPLIGLASIGRFELSKIGTLGLLLKAKQINLISSIRSDVETLHARGFSLSSKVINDVLAQAGESD